LSDLIDAKLKSAVACKLQWSGQMNPSKTFKLLLTEEVETYLQGFDIVGHYYITF
jgi:hypothetical protein